MFWRKNGRVEEGGRVWRTNEEIVVSCACHVGSDAKMQRLRLQSSELRRGINCRAVN